MAAGFGRLLAAAALSALPVTAALGRTRPRRSSAAGDLDRRLSSPEEFQSREWSSPTSVFGAPHRIARAGVRARGAN